MNENHEAFDEAMKLRVQATTVRLDLCAGRFYCTLLGASEDCLGHGEAPSLKAAVHKAVCGYSLRQFWKQRSVTGVAYETLKTRGWANKVFSTFAFVNQLHTESKHTISEQEATELLDKEPQIVRLGSGDAWLLLPDGYVRYDSN